jgi:hypothetical protein
LETNTELRRSKVILPSGFGYSILAHSTRRLQIGVVGSGAVDGPRGDLHAQLGQQPVLDAGHDHADVHALLEPLFEVLGRVQLFLQPALLERSRVGAQFVVLTLGVQASKMASAHSMPVFMAACEPLMRAAFR